MPSAPDAAQWRAAELLLALHRSRDSDVEQTVGKRLQIT